MALDLSDRQKEVVRLTSLGCTVGEVAKILKISPSTVDNHRQHAMGVMGVNKVALLTRVALKHRISSMKDKLTNLEKRRSGRKKDGWN